MTKVPPPILVLVGVPRWRRKLDRVSHGTDKESNQEGFAQTAEVQKSGDLAVRGALRRRVVEQSR